MTWLIKLRARFLVWMMQTRPYRFLLRYVLPNLRLLQAPGPGYSVKNKIRREMLPGDILLSKSKFALTNFIIGGEFSHAALVLEKDAIAEMSARDFDVVDVDHFCDGVTRVVLLRLKDYEPLYGNQMVLRALSLADSRYDIKFTLGVEALYCSELVYQSDYQHRIKADLSDLVGLGVPYLSPDGVYSAPGVDKVFEWVDSGW